MVGGAGAKIIMLYTVQYSTVTESNENVYEIRVVTCIHTRNYIFRVLMPLRRNRISTYPQGSLFGHRGCATMLICLGVTNQTELLAGLCDFFPEFLIAARA